MTFFFKIQRKCLLDKLPWKIHLSVSVKPTKNKQLQLTADVSPFNSTDVEYDIVSIEKKLMSDIHSSNL